MPELAQQLFGGLAAVVKPRPDTEIWEWAEANLEIPPGYPSPAGPGPIRFGPSAPYAVGEWGPLWAFRRYERSDHIWAAQTGKTFNTLILTLAYCVLVDPGPCMVVFPTGDVCSRRSKKHFLPFLVHNCQSVTTGNKDHLQILEYTFTTCTVVLAWAGSESILAGESIKHLFADEKAKYQGQTEAETGAIENAQVRTTAYEPFATTVGATTPNLEHKPGWADWPHSTQCQFYVPCPVCASSTEPFAGESRNAGWQVMYFSHEDRNWLESEDGAEWTGGIKWDPSPELTREQRIDSAYYQCQDCGARWTNHQKNSAVRRGRWHARYPEAKRYTSHLPAWYSPRVTLAKIVGEWFDCYRDENKRHHFLNNRAAVPYVLTGSKLDKGPLQKHVNHAHHRGTVPSGCVALVLTVDVHDDHLRYRVGAHFPDTSFQGVESGNLLPDLGTVDKLLQKTYTRDGKPVQIDVGIVDSGYRTDEVYQLCLRHPGRLWPAKGGDGRDLLRFSPQTVTADPQNGIQGGKVMLVNYNDDRWKSLLLSRFKTSEGTPGYWSLEAETDEEWFHQMAGEQLRSKPNTRGVPVYTWHRTHDNHAQDCEKLQAIAQEVFQIASLAPPAVETESTAGAIINPYTNQPV